MTPRRYFSQFSNMPIPDHIKDMDLGPNIWFAFTALSGISRLFTYTPPKTEGGQAGANQDNTVTNTNDGIEDSPDTKSP